MPRPVGLLAKLITNWRAGCGRPACPVRREGRVLFPSLPLSTGNQAHLSGSTHHSRCSPESAGKTRRSFPDPRRPTPLGLLPQIQGTADRSTGFRQPWRPTPSASAPPSNKTAPPSPTTTILETPAPQSSKPLPTTRGANSRRRRPISAPLKTTARNYRAVSMNLPTTTSATARGPIVPAPAIPAPVSRITRTTTPPTPSINTSRGITKRFPCRARWTATPKWS